MEKKKTCSSCHIELSNKIGSTEFKCPNCGKATITRCNHCRKIATRYKCPECGFEGPN